MRRIVRQRILKSGLIAFVFIIVLCVTFTINRTYIEKNTDMVSVAVALHKVPAYSKVSRVNVSTKALPRSAVPPQAITDPAVYFNGKTFYAGDLGFGPGDIIRADRLITENTAAVGNLAKLQDENKMLLAINTNLVKSCANLVKPGAVVNAVVFIKGQNTEDTDKVISPAEDPRLGGLLVVDKKNADASPPPEKGREAIPAVITIQLDAENHEAAKALVQYNEQGSIYLLPVGFKGEVYLASQIVQTS